MLKKEYKRQNALTLMYTPTDQEIALLKNNLLEYMGKLHKVEEQQKNIEANIDDYLAKYMSQVVDQDGELIDTNSPEKQDESLQTVHLFLQSYKKVNQEISEEHFYRNIETITP